MSKYTNEQNKVLLIELTVQKEHGITIVLCPKGYSTTVSFLS